MSTEDPVLNPENRMIRKKDGSLDEGRVFKICQLFIKKLHFEAFNEISKIN